MLTEARLRAILAWVAIVLLAVPVGGALYLGYVKGDSPCILCWAERTSMLLIALVALFVLRHGPRPRYLGTVIVLAGWGLFMATRHSGLHLARDVGQGFAEPILGAHTYTWAWVIHFVALIAIAALMMLQREEPLAPGVRELSSTGKAATLLFVVVAALNAVQAFASTGIPPWIGQGDPVRFTLNPRHWVRSTDETQGKVSLRGGWTIPEPDLAALDPDPAHGPVAGLAALHIDSTLASFAAVATGGVAGFAFDSARERYAVLTDRWDVDVIDAAGGRAIHHVRLDPEFSVDMGTPAGVAFIGGDTLLVLSTNKSYAVLVLDPKADAEAEWRHFIETSGGVREIARSRFQTVRARQLYVRSLAYDPAAREIITVGLANPRHAALVVSRFSRGDLLLSSEFEPGSGTLQFSNDRSKTDWAITALAVRGRTLYAVSAAYATLLAVDLDTRQITGAWTVPGVVRPVGLVVMGGKLEIMQQDGRRAVVAMP